MWCIIMCLILDCVLWYGAMQSNGYPCAIGLALMAFIQQIMLYYNKQSKELENTRSALAKSQKEVEDLKAEMQGMIPGDKVDEMLCMQQIHFKAEHLQFKTRRLAFTWLVSYKIDALEAQLDHVEKVLGSVQEKTFGLKDFWKTYMILSHARVRWGLLDLDNVVESVENTFHNFAEMMVGDLMIAEEFVPLIGYID